MAVRSRLFSSDEEHGKRDDDRKPNKRSNAWQASQLPLLRRRRLLGLAAVSFLVWLFIHNIPNLGPAKYRYPYGHQGRVPHPLDVEERSPEQALSPPEDPPPPQPPPTVRSPDKAAENVRRDFEGPVRFYYLASSLHSIARTMGHRSANKNVLFVASDLKSASDIIPLACEMGRWNRNFVHVAIMGRDELSLEDIKRINGAEKRVCDIYWHDARPDYADDSTDLRMEVSVAGALGHIESFMHPQAVVSANRDNEDEFFFKGISRKTKELKQTYIELPPRGKIENLGWMTRLESSSLNAWHSSTIDIVIQAPKESSGSVIRLLQSLARADYSGFDSPRLIIELAHKLNEETMSFLDRFAWPPSNAKSQSSQTSNEVFLRRRIPEKLLSAEEASIRFIESFYPANSQQSHALILSPQAELSPAFFHFLKYYLLEYKYTSSNSPDLFGISLESPSVHLNGTAGFQPPTVSSKRSKEGDVAEEGEAILPYLWQAPSSNAALYFGDKWIELHSFLTKHYTATRHPLTKVHHRNRQKVVSDKHPAWAEYLLDLMRARGYYMLYPGFNTQLAAETDSASLSTDNALAIVHNDLYQPPEEFSNPLSLKTTPSEQIPESNLLEVSTDYLDAHPKSPDVDVPESERPLVRKLLQILPHAPPPMVASGEEPGDTAAPEGKTARPSAALPVYGSLPALDFRGDSVSLDDLHERAEKVTVGYRRAAGGCSEEKSRNNGEILYGSAEDLFCLDEEEDEVAKGGAQVSVDTTRNQGDANEQVAKDDASEVEPRNRISPANEPTSGRFTDNRHEEEENKDRKPVGSLTPTEKHVAHDNEGAAGTIDSADEVEESQRNARVGSKIGEEKAGKAYEDEYEDIGNSNKGQRKEPANPKDRNGHTADRGPKDVLDEFPKLRVEDVSAARPSVPQDKPKAGVDPDSEADGKNSGFGADGKTPSRQQRPGIRKQVSEEDRSDPAIRRIIGWDEGGVDEGAKDETRAAGEAAERQRQRAIREADGRARERPAVERIRDEA